ncbi:UDP-4-amino-4,6-dideoxy-N-acetyl-beta-L-altrosamine N-acetyltransferase [Helicobacter valdiviensis]|uniref:UDP-4-amino-4, 6-dideoxy-N-acetyl-beta-L-altrosamine N-acetyltransferase n=1 Tax=Helicobacter valdiviensis TaxID=1458358 RepID=A0A2W6MWA5_9HELI|nr:UDP-4-amino-4,6-dideoxy-N-acetyl-beta-L-altrosamine N-acetyltransferase [Helicobacter valdiviensis]PZT48795.1 UDP-4-amino-4,6-dideoxy-N-acetyl-beta-L-altrosamine N-acetyltransferase [Helicobacter valdiviensis]
MIELKNFTKLSKEEAIMVLNWRNHPNVASFMNNATISPKEHLEFLQSLKSAKDKEYFLAYEGEIPIGVIDFINIKVGDSCEFGIYQNPNLKGQGNILMEALLDYAFGILKVKELKAHVKCDNIKAMNLYDKFGFKQVGEKIINNQKMKFIKLDSTLYYSGGGG